MIRAWEFARGSAGTGTEPASAAPADDLVARAARDEATVRAEFWPKIRRFAARLPFAEDLLAAYYCAFDRDTPRHVRIAILGALAYFVLPTDLVPDFVAGLGFTDDAAVLATVLKLFFSHVSPEHREAARHALDELAR
ncbi:YkvA family protein [Rhodovulum sp. PH10]|uniref:YkvA family protein n=1 Tax=Rhodovulum sp. PH10 TaxID=1187851 RepID=UPI0002E29ABF|nr:YkvA family protein [Rhodovulum sp. PH10]